MNITITPQFSNMQNYQHSKKNNVQFTGLIGDKFVGKLAEQGEVTVADIMKEAKGTFGLNSGKVQDILESFVESISSLVRRNKALEQNLNKAEERIAEIPSLETAAATRAADEQIQRFSSIISGKDATIAAKEKELQESTELLAKYKPVVAVKSVEEIGTVMPERALEVFKEMVEHKAAANKSMFDFLMTGKGQEEALEQIERNNILMRAHTDGIMGIPAIRDQYNIISVDNGVSYTRGDIFTINLIGRALKSDPKGEYIASPVIRAQVKKNAMAILTPMADERSSYTGIKAVESELDRELDSVAKFHDGFKKGLAKQKKNYEHYYSFDYEINRVENDVDKSTVKFTYQDKKESQPRSWESSFYDVSCWGQSNY